MSNTLIKIKQPFYVKYVSALKKLTKKLSRIKTDPNIQRDSEVWYGLEQANDRPFRWSHPITRIKLQNVDQVVIVLSDPLGRELNIKTKEVDQTVKLSPDLEHKIIISTYDADEITLRIDPFNPESDSRSLGAQYYSITSEDTLLLN